MLAELPSQVGFASLGRKLEVSDDLECASVRGPLARWPGIRDSFRRTWRCSSRPRGQLHQLHRTSSTATRPKQDHGTSKGGRS